MLGPNAVPQMDAYVPIIDKTVRAHVHDDVGILQRRSIRCHVEGIFSLVYG